MIDRIGTSPALAGLSELDAVWSATDPPLFAGAGCCAVTQDWRVCTREGYTSEPYGVRLCSQHRPLRIEGEDIWLRVLLAAEVVDEKRLARRANGSLIRKPSWHPGPGIYISPAAIAAQALILDPASRVASATAPVDPMADPVAVRFAPTPVEPEDWRSDPTGSQIVVDAFYRGDADHDGPGPSPDALREALLRCVTPERHGLRPTMLRIDRCAPLQDPDPDGLRQPPIHPQMPRRLPHRS